VVAGAAVVGAGAVVAAAAGAVVLVAAAAVLVAVPAADATGLVAVATAVDEVTAGTGPAAWASAIADQPQSAATVMSAAIRSPKRAPSRQRLALRPLRSLVDAFRLTPFLTEGALL
jgi:hypothetical protein